MIGEEIIGIIGRTGTVFQHRSGPSNDLDWRSSVPAEKLPDSSAFSQPPDVRLIPLTQGKFAMVDASDYEFLMQWKWCAQRKKGNYWRAVRRDAQDNYVYMHRQIIGAPKESKVDHRDGDALHNWRGNLRLATNSQNLCNRGPDRNNTSGFKGVHWDKSKNKWAAEIHINNRKVFLGRFSDINAAATAYADAATKYHGHFARTQPFRKSA